MPTTQSQSNWHFRMTLPIRGSTETEKPFVPEMRLLFFLYSEMFPELFHHRHPQLVLIFPSCEHAQQSTTFSTCALFWISSALSLFFSSFFFTCQEGTSPGGRKHVRRVRAAAPTSACRLYIKALSLPGSVLPLRPRSVIWESCYIHKFSSLIHSVLTFQVVTD